MNNATTTATMTMTQHQTPAQIEDEAIQLHREFVEIVREEIGMNEAFANTMAAALVRGMRKRYGGQRLGRKDIYVPAPSKAARNAAIRQEFNGTNRDEVCKKHGISRAMLYVIVSKRTQ